MNSPIPGDDTAALRRQIRTGAVNGCTAGLAPRAVQGNLVILPADAAGDFLRYCTANPKPCPVLAVGEPGDPTLPGLGEDIDVRTDVPRYRIWRDGTLKDEPTDIADLWRDDLVTFVLGCSFTFEWALMAAGLNVRHVALGRNVPMYRTAIETVCAGPFGGALVVTMRPYRPADAIRAIQITSRFPGVHGAPVHFGDAAEIGIADLARPSFGDAPDVYPGEVPVFWACGVTPQVALEAARLPFAITHSPGAMLITDRMNEALSVL